jgi:hypothetical protein
MKLSVALVLVAVALAVPGCVPSTPASTSSASNPNAQAAREARRALEAMGAFGVLEGVAAAGSHACEGRGWEVRGSDVAVQLTGDCPLVVVTGDRNTVTLQRVAAVDVVGNGNTVSWDAGSTPTTSVRGEGNSVAAR